MKHSYDRASKLKFSCEQENRSKAVSETLQTFVAFLLPYTILRMYVHIYVPLDYYVAYSLHGGST